MPDTDRVGGLLRPLPFRGDLIAAGSVPLAIGVLLVDVRMDGAWAAGVRFAVVGAVAALLLALAWRAPVEAEAPRMYVSVLLAAAFPLLLAALIELGDALGGDPGSAGTLTWVLALVAATYAFLARARNSAICTLLAAVAAAGALLALWTWAFDPQSPTPYRWLLLAAIVAFGLGVLRLRDTRRAHAVALVDAAGLAAVALGVVSVIAGIGLSGVSTGQVTSGATSGGTGWGWKLVLLVLGFGLVAYATADRERGPGWLGAVVLLLFVAIAADHASLLWWPLLLIVLGGAVVAAGLRPTIPAPPSPDADAPPAPTRPLGPSR
jgi:hypothetical protein